MYNAGLVLSYVGLVSLLVWLGWLIGSWLEFVLGKQIGKWIKYLIMAVVIPFSLLFVLFPSSMLFHYLIYENTPKWIWGMDDVATNSQDI